MIKAFPRHLFAAALLAALFAWLPADSDADERPLRVAVIGNSPPMSYEDERGRLVGFNIEMAEALCQTMRVRPMTPEELIRFLDGRMARFMIPRYVDIIEAMPKTPTGKIQKYVLRERGLTPTTWDRETAGIKLKR